MTNIRYLSQPHKNKRIFPGRKRCGNTRDLTYEQIIIVVRSLAVAGVYEEKIQDKFSMGRFNGEKKMKFNVTKSYKEI